MNEQAKDDDKRNFFKWAQASEKYDDVASWQLDGLDIWPIFKTGTLLAAHQSYLELGVPKSGFMDAGRKVMSHALNKWDLKEKIRAKWTSKLPDDLHTSSLLFCLSPSSMEQSQDQVHHPMADIFLRKAYRQNVDTGILWLSDFDVNIKFASYNFAIQNHFNTVRWSDGEKLSTKDISAALPEAALAWLKEAQMRAGLGVIDVDQILSLVRIVLHQRDYFTRYLDTVKPKTVVTQNSYGPSGWALCAAGHQKEIPILDLQHGVQGPLHEAYTFSNTSPFSLSASQCNTLPQGYMVWDRSASDHLKSWVQLPDNIFEFIPFRFLSEASRGQSQPKINRSKRITNARPRALYFGTRNQNIEELQKLKSSVKPWLDLHIRYHPLHARKNAEPNYDFMEALNDADFAVSMMSSAMIEAQYAGLPVLIISEHGATLFEQVLDQNHVHCGPLNQDSVEHVLSQIPTQRPQPLSWDATCQASWLRFCSTFGL